MIQGLSGSVTLQDGKGRQYYIDARELENIEGHCGHDCDQQLFRAPVKSERDVEVAVALISATQCSGSQIAMGPTIEIRSHGNMKFRVSSNDLDVNVSNDED